MLFRLYSLNVRKQLVYVYYFKYILAHFELVMQMNNWTIECVIFAQERRSPDQTAVDLKIWMKGRMKSERVEKDVGDDEVRAFFCLLIFFYSWKALFVFWATSFIDFTIFIHKGF